LSQAPVTHKHTHLLYESPEGLSFKDHKYCCNLTL